MKKGSREYVDSRAKTTQVNLHFDNFELSDFFFYRNLWYLVYSTKSVSAGREFIAVLAVYCIRGFYFFLLGLFFFPYCAFVGISFVQSVLAPLYFSCRLHFWCVAINEYIA